MEGWPAGWVGHDVGGDSQRYVSPGARYVIYGEPEGSRRAAWAIVGGGAVDRETLARALHAAYEAVYPIADRDWDALPGRHRDGYLAEADEAIRLLGGGSDRADLLAQIEELRSSNANLIATTNAAVLRAEEAQRQAKINTAPTGRISDLEAQVKHLQERLAHAQSEHEVYRRAHAAAVEQLDQANATARGLAVERDAAAERAASRIELAKVTCADALRRAEVAERQVGAIGDLRATVARLRRTIDIMAQANERLGDALSEMARDDE